MKLALAQAPFTPSLDTCAPPLLEYEQEVNLLSKIIRVLRCNPVLVKYYTGLSLGFIGGSETFRWLKG